MFQRSEIQGAGAEIIHCTAKFFRKTGFILLCFTFSTWCKVRACCT